MYKNRPVRIAIVGPRGIVQESLARILSSQPGVASVSQHSDVNEIITAHRAAPSSVILANHDADWDKPLEALIQQTSRSGCADKVLVLTTGLDKIAGARLVQRGVGGICLKRNSLDRLMEAVRAVAEGGTWFDPAVSWTMGARAERETEAKSPFTDRELVALRALLEGCSNKEIGARLGASEAAAKGLLQRLFRKTDVRSRGQLIRVALEKYRDLL